MDPYWQCNIHVKRVYRKFHMLAIRLPADIESRLAALAKATGRTKTYYAREAILDSLADMESYYLAVKTLERVRSGDEPTYSLDEVEAKLGLGD